MSEATFPATRISDAGGSDLEVAQLKREFERSDITVQIGLSAYFRSISTGDIVEYLDTLRESGHFEGETTESEAEDTDESESLAADTDPASDESAADDESADTSADDDEALSED